MYHRARYDRAGLDAAVLAGGTDLGLARRFNVDKSTVARRRRALGVPAAPRGRPLETRSGGAGGADRQAAHDRLSGGLRPLTPEQRRLVEDNVQFARWLARRLAAVTRFPLDELEQEAAFGLARAAVDWDPARAGFRTLATQWVRHYMQRWIQNHSRDVRVPVHASESMRAARPDGSARSRFDDGVLLTRRVRSDAPLGVRSSSGLRAAPTGTWADRRGLTVSDALADPAPPADELLAEAQEAARLEAAVASLPQREAEVVRLRFGLGGAEPMLLREVAELMGGICRERVRQVEAAALAKLRERLAG